jgi:hypothetical protein
MVSIRQSARIMGKDDVAPTVSEDEIHAFFSSVDRIRLGAETSPK